MKVSPRNLVGTLLSAVLLFGCAANSLHREGLAEVERGMRRNLLRSLSLDAFAAALEKAS